MYDLSGLLKRWLWLACGKRTVGRQGVEARKFIEAVSVAQDLGRHDLVALTGCGNVPVEMYLPVKPDG